MARLVVARRGVPELVEETSDPADPDRELFTTDGLLTAPEARLAGPSFEEWETGMRVVIGCGGCAGSAP
jgi:hypothetical protein